MGLYKQVNKHRKEENKRAAQKSSLCYFPNFHG